MSAGVDGPGAGAHRAAATPPPTRPLPPAPRASLSAPSTVLKAVGPDRTAASGRGQTPPRTVGTLLATAAAPTVSCEFFPPKSPSGEAALWTALRELERLRPSFVSVTYGAGGSTREGTLAVARRIGHETTMMSLAHLTAVDHSIAELRHTLARLAATGVRNVLALRGDPPGADPQAPWRAHPHGVRYAAELVELIRSVGDFSVGVAAFPEKHPRSPDLDTDVDRFVAKCRAGADFAITQMFFRAEDYLRLRDRVAARGCDVPLLAGVMPVTKVAQIARIVQLSGQAFPAELAARFAELDGERPEDQAAVAAYGVDVATELCQTLLKQGVPGLHFITMNRAAATRAVCANLGGQLLTGARRPATTGVA